MSKWIEAPAKCDLAPRGWRCTRKAYHVGPCAAVRLPLIARIRQSVKDFLPRSIRRIFWKISDLPFDVKRSIKFWWQRRTRGFDDSETWSLDNTLAKWLVPRLRRFKQLNICIWGPNDEDGAVTDKIIDEIVWTFEFLGSDDFYEAPPNDPRWQRYEKGLDLFRENINHLWW